MTFTSLDHSRQQPQGQTHDPFGRQVMTPSSLSARIQENFDGFGAVWLVAEISGFRSSSAGHWYFSLKDHQAVIKAAIWKSRQPYMAAQPRDGWLVMVRGRLDLYAPRGDWRLTVDYLEPQGEGALKLAFEELKAKLEAEGLFRPERKRVLPFWPNRVALVTSPTGAVVMDFIKVAERRRPNLHLSVYPVTVQGPEAAGEIIRALKNINAWGRFDLIVLARGGGSLEDLWPFNHEGLARAIGESAIPVVSAIGHETDFTIADYAADLRAPTPSAAAELIYRPKADLEAHLKTVSARLTGLLGRNFRQAALKLGHLSAGLNCLPRRLSDLERALAFQQAALKKALKTLLFSKANRLARLGSELYLNGPQARWARQEGSLARLKILLITAVNKKLKRREWQAQALADRLRLLSPLNILARGYALIFKEPEPGREPLTIRSAGALKPGDHLILRLADGARRVKVLEER